MEKVLLLIVSVFSVLLPSRTIFADEEDKRNFINASVEFQKASTLRFATIAKQMTSHPKVVFRDCLTERTYPIVGTHYYDGGVGFSLSFNAADRVRRESIVVEVEPYKELPRQIKAFDSREGELAWKYENIIIPSSNPSSLDLFGRIRRTSDGSLVAMIYFSHTYKGITDTRTTYCSTGPL